MGNTLKTLDLEKRSRSASIVANQRAAQARRRELAASFRARLQAESQGEGVGRETLIESAVSAYVEQAELSQAFLRGNASTTAIARLHLIRGQLSRFLRMLGLVAAVPSEPDDAPEEPLAAWVDTLKTAPGETSSEPSKPDGNGVA